MSDYKGLTDVENANIRKAVAFAQLKRQQYLYLEIDDLRERAKESLCAALGRYSEAEKAVREAEKKDQNYIRLAQLERMNFVEWYNKAAAEDIRNAMKINAKKLLELREKYSQDIIEP